MQLALTARCGGLSIAPTPLLCPPLDEGTFSPFEEGGEGVKKSPVWQGKGGYGGIAVHWRIPIREDWKGWQHRQNSQWPRVKG